MTEPQEEMKPSVDPVRVAEDLHEIAQGLELRGKRWGRQTWINTFLSVLAVVVVFALVIVVLNGHSNALAGCARGNQTRQGNVRSEERFVTLLTGADVTISGSRITITGGNQPAAENIKIRELLSYYLNQNRPVDCLQVYPILPGWLP